ncbi:MAG: ribonuclease P protein component [Marmoricola sp.]
MLPASNRLRDGATYRATVRRGRRAAAAAVVLHQLAGGEEGPPRVGLVVSRAVGNAVTRNHVKRRLRHQLRERLRLLPDGSVLVVRALPATATMSSTELAAELDTALTRLTGRR